MLMQMIFYHCTVISRGWWWCMRLKSIPAAHFLLVGITISNMVLKLTPWHSKEL